MLYSFNLKVCILYYFSYDLNVVVYDSVNRSQRSCLGL